jgi:branched-chain amino acid transport system permease protein
MFPLAFLIVRGRFGRSLRAVRDSEIAATANGVSTAAMKTAAFGISAFYCGVAGSLYAIGITYVNPDTFPIDLSILLLVGIVLGGAGSLYGMLFGALFVEFIRISWGPALLDLFSRVHHIDTHAPGSGLVVYGVVLLLVLYAAPAGAAGLARGLSGRQAFLRRKEDPSFSDPGLV